MNLTMTSFRCSFAFCIAATLVLGGCVSNSLTDLEVYSQEVLARPGGRIEPLPEIKPYERYLYQAANAGYRDPFLPFYEEALAGGPTATGVPENPFEEECKARNPEELENFELDSLRMVGTLENDNELWGIIVDSIGDIYRVKVGNYMGRYCGKILSIDEYSIELREIIGDAATGFDERTAVVALAEQE